MTHEAIDDGMNKERDENPHMDTPRMAAGRWMPVGLAIALALVVGLFGGAMVTSLTAELFGQQQPPGLDNAGNIERRADRLAGEGPIPLAIETTPVAQEVAGMTRTVVETVETIDTRQQERRTLAHESPLTPPVADIAQRIRKQQAAAMRGVAGFGFDAANGAPDANRRQAAGPTLADGSSALNAAPVFADAGSAAPLPQKNVPLYRLYRGSVISAVLESAIDSDLPGLVRARTTRNVYDSRTGTRVLIPRGSRLIGTYGQGAAGGLLRQGGQGANRHRLFVAWQEMRLPDGTPVVLDNFPALGADGASGIRARRATGFIEALGAAVLFDLAGNATAIIAAATGTPIQPRGGANALVGAIAGALGNSTQKVAADYVGSLLARGPRFRVKAGSFMNVIVERDLMLPASGPSPFAVRAPGNNAFATRDEAR